MPRVLGDFDDSLSVVLLRVFMDLPNNLKLKLVFSSSLRGDDV